MHFIAVLRCLVLPNASTARCSPRQSMRQIIPPVEPIALCATVAQWVFSAVTALTLRSKSKTRKMLNTLTPYQPHLASFTLSL